MHLATFPEEFRQGMVARAEVLGDTGRNSRIVGLAVSPVRRCTRSRFFFARNAAERERATREHQAFLARTPGRRSAFITGS